MDMTKFNALMANKKASMQKREKTAKVQPGKNRIRLLPGWRKGEEYVWFHDFGQHFIKDAADVIQAVFPCNHATYEKPCEVCDAIAKASRSVTDDDTQNVLAKAKPSRVVLVNALMLDSTEPNTPVILELKRGVFSQIIEIVEEWGGAAAFDLDTGKEIVITREGKALNTKYSAQISPKTYPIPVAVLSKLHNLDDYVKTESEENQRRAIAAVNSVAGFLPAPSNADTPKTPATTRLAAPASAAAFDDVSDFDETPAAPPAAAPRADLALDAELDDLLGDLDA